MLEKIKVIDKPAAPDTEIHLKLEPSCQSGNTLDRVLAMMC